VLLFVWEFDLVQNLMIRLEGVVLGGDPDCWVWKAEEGGVFPLVFIRKFCKVCV